MASPATARTLRPCGTDAAYQRHLRRGEPIDDVCRVAHNAEMAKRKAPHREQIAARERARRTALEVLRHRYPGEYARLYAAAMREEAALAGGAR